MSDQLPISLEPTPAGRLRYRLYEHEGTRRLWSFEWNEADELTGTAGPITGEPSEAELARLDYNRNPLVVGTARRDFLDQRYTLYIRSEELA